MRRFFADIDINAIAQFPHFFREVFYCVNFYLSHTVSLLWHSSADPALCGIFTLPESRIPVAAQPKHGAGRKRRMSPNKNAG
jgi:hypothetical protein